MAQEWQYMNTVNGRDKLDVAVTANEEKLQELAVNLGGLQACAAPSRARDVRSLSPGS